MISALAEGVLVRGRDGSIELLNETGRQLLGLTVRQLEGIERSHSGVALIHEDGRRFAPGALPSQMAMASGSEQKNVLMGIVGPHRPMRWISVNSRALYEPGEMRPYAAVSSFADVTAHRRTVDELNSARFENLKRLALVSEYRDDDTHRHTERVARTAGLIAIRLGLDEEMVAVLERAAPLHDVGKIGISDGILLKPSQLSSEELATMRAHTTIGGRILGESESPILKMAAEIALTHHERWDGAGYPSGIAGAAIPLAGRIVAVADAFDAMVHARPYKNPMPVAAAVEEISSCSGLQFDPRVVEAFIALDHAALVDRG